MKKFTKEDPQKMKRYISLYLDVSPKTFEAMKLNLKNEDWEQLRINAHSLKPQADFMGINSLKEELIKIEEAVTSNNFDILENLFNTSFKIATDSEIILKEMLEEL
ncbi:MAG: Hpt domain-containing protein [Saprospiraceae bacterium]|uniref:Hpt domain-containing protein n=1 Tax=Candidatus Brachybacter algidus TaxID=2982024 RepID=UPI001B51D999|nr:Hpt domain-containing protein [Candidatus Brachybacter algidus]MBP9126464.1 Hpt domain-containing protein [Saprospiraceae bacterium]MBK6373800.1 Hpt domain-containing protein [Candidatus Brachybacter algidus]MBK6448975.1 Hpt domain-containing protein [Candidatus Brachybacter algidus]MBK8357342.1 Hpt domain-containing protein [Candidatus Brachybacter algidus]MBK8604765.1 Hpt domain-containing protein [Candidatus Brachybacter algidus]